MDSFVVGAQLLLAAVFALAGGAKLSDLAGSGKAVADFGVPARVAPVVGVLVPLAELAAAAALIFRPTARWGALLALLLLIVFVGGVANAMRKGLDVDCGCFGRVYSATAGSATLVRNAVLAALAAVVVVHGSGPAINDWVGARSGAELVAIGTSVVAVFLVAVSWWLWSRNRTLRRDLELLRSAPVTTEELPPPPERDPYGLPVGTGAPAFELPDLHGDTHTLDSLLAHGRPVVLTFLAVGCGPCGKVIPDVARWRESLADRLTMVVITDGEPDQIRDRWEELGVEHVLLDPSEEMLKAYGLAATPTSLVIDRNGLIASTPSSGILGVEVLVRRALRLVPGTVRPAQTLPAVLQYGASSA
jgi:peroxiredoxin/cbb3-type cytochrome oxidase subunit 3